MPELKIVYASEKILNKRTKLYNFNFTKPYPWIFSQNANSPET